MTKPMSKAMSMFVCKRENPEQLSTCFQRDWWVLFVCFYSHFLRGEGVVNCLKYLEMRSRVKKKEKLRLVLKCV